MPATLNLQKRDAAFELIEEEAEGLLIFDWNAVDRLQDTGLNLLQAPIDHMEGRLARRIIRLV
jgi:hypothetical protein